MARMTLALQDGERVSIDEALAQRALSRSNHSRRSRFTCEECGRPVRAHKQGGHAQAHFEHLARNPTCSRSDNRLR